jgi:hypothetical protein
MLNSQRFARMGYAKFATFRNVSQNAVTSTPLEGLKTSVFKRSPVDGFQIIAVLFQIITVFPLSVRLCVSVRACSLGGGFLNSQTPPVDFLLHTYQNPVPPSGCTARRAVASTRRKGVWRRVALACAPTAAAALRAFPRKPLRRTGEFRTAHSAHATQKCAAQRLRSVACSSLTSCQVPAALSSPVS